MLLIKQILISWSVYDHHHDFFLKIVSVHIVGIILPGWIDWMVQFKSVYRSRQAIIGGGFDSLWSQEFEFNVHNALHVHLLTFIVIEVGLVFEMKKQFTWINHCLRTVANVVPYLGSKKWCATCNWNGKTWKKKWPIFCVFQYLTGNRIIFFFFNGKQFSHFLHRPHAPNCQITTSKERNVVDIPRIFGAIGPQQRTPSRPHFHKAHLCGKVKNDF